MLMCLAPQHDPKLRTYCASPMVNLAIKDTAYLYEKRHSAKLHPHVTPEMCSTRTQSSQCTISTTAELLSVSDITL